MYYMNVRCIGTERPRLALLAFASASSWAAIHDSTDTQPQFKL